MHQVVSQIGSGPESTTRIIAAISQLYSGNTFTRKQRFRVVSLDKKINGLKKVMAEITLSMALSATTIQLKAEALARSMFPGKKNERNL